MNKVEVFVEENLFVSALKTVVLAIVFTIIALLLLTAYIAYGDISEESAVLCVKTATFVSMFSAGFMTARKRRKTGLLSGLVSGGIYVLIMLMAGLLVVDGFSVNGETLLMYLISVLSSSIGGIFGVNFKKKNKK